MNSRWNLLVRWAFALALLLAAAPGSLSTQASPEAPVSNTMDCVDFESLPASATYAVGDTFVDAGVLVTARAFTWTNGTVFNGGTASVGTAGLAGGSGQEINTNNINLDFDFGAQLSSLRVAFGEYGGNLNIEINGDFQNFQNFVDIDGSVIGGVSVAVTGGMGNDTGMLTLTGPIDQFAIGGQELWIDDVCPEEGECCPESDCLDFESLAVGTVYNVGDSFSDSGYDVKFVDFVWSNGTPTSGGYAKIDNAGLAGGSGLELQTNNINAVIDFKRILKGLSFDFGEYGGNLNIEINGDFRNFDNFADIDGAVIGGVGVRVVNGLGNDTGQVYLSGPLSMLTVGGQELWLDNFCPEGDCVDFESLPAGASYIVGDTFIDSGAEMEVLPFEWSNGTLFSGGSAHVGSAGLAGGTGQELNTNNVNAGFHFGPVMPLKTLTLSFGEYGGNLNIEVNGDFVNFDNFADIHGMIVGGVNVSVTNGLGNDTGTLELKGLIHSFAVGGQELWIDDVCPTPAERIYLPLVRG